MYKVIKNPSEYGFVKQKGLIITCYKKPEFIAKDIKEIIECIKQLQLDDIMYIYDYDTNMQFTFEIYEGKHSFGVFAHYRDFEKDKLIDFLYKHGLDMFKHLNENPEKFGFEDNAGM